MGKLNIPYEAKNATTIYTITPENTNQIDGDLATGTVAGVDGVSYVNLGKYCEIVGVKALSIASAGDVTHIYGSAESTDVFGDLNPVNYIDFTPVVEGAVTPEGNYPYEADIDPAQVVKWIIIEHTAEVREIEVYQNIARVDGGAGDTARLTDGTNTELPFTGTGDEITYTATFPNCNIGGTPSASIPIRLQFPAAVQNSGAWTLQIEADDGADYVEVSLDNITFQPVTTCKAGIDIGGGAAGTFKEIYIRTNAQAGGSLGAKTCKMNLNIEVA